MNVGDMYAVYIRIVAVGLIYGPFYTPAYAVSAVTLFLSIASMRNGIAHFYKAPPQVGVTKGHVTAA